MFNKANYTDDRIINLCNGCSSTKIMIYQHKIRLTFKFLTAHFSNVFEIFKQVINRSIIEYFNFNFFSTNYKQT